MMMRRLRLALISLVLLSISTNFLYAQFETDPINATTSTSSTTTSGQTTLQESTVPYVDATSPQTTEADNNTLKFDATTIERFGAISVLASQKVYTVSKGTHNQQERDAEGNHILNAIELELQIAWRVRKVVENKEDINVYVLNDAGEFVLTKTVKYGTDVELTPYEYLEEDVLRYKGVPDPNFNLSDYTQYAKGKKAPAFRLRVQAEYRTFIENNKELVSAIGELATKYGYRGFEVSYFNSVVTKESNNFTPAEEKSNLLLKNLFKKSFWKETYMDPKMENKTSKQSAALKLTVGLATSFGVYFYNSGGKILDHYSDPSLITFTVLLCGWTVAKELMYSKWMATYANFYDKVKTLGRSTNYFKAVTSRFKPGTQKTLSELWSMRIMVVQTGLFLLFEKFLLGGIDNGLLHAGAEMTGAWISGILLLKMLSMTTVLSNAGFGNFVTKGLYGYNGRITRTRLFDILAPARDVLTNVYPNKWMGFVYYGGKLGIWAASKFIGYKDYTDFILAADKANRNAVLNATTNELTKLDNASEFFYSKSTYGYIQGVYNEDETLNRIIVAIDDIDLNEASSTKRSTDKFFTLELPESVWRSLSEGRTYGDVRTVYTYNSDGDPVAIDYNVNTKEIVLPKGAVDSYVTIFTDIKDVVNEGEEAYARGLHATVFRDYAKSGDPTINEQKKASAATLLFSGENSTLSKILKVKHAFTNIDLLTLDTILGEMAVDFPVYKETIKTAINAIEQELTEREVSSSDIIKGKDEIIKDVKNKVGDSEKVIGPTKISENVDKISINLSKYEAVNNEELTRDAIERFLTQNFANDEEIVKKMKGIKSTEIEELFKLSLLAFAKAQADKSMELEKMQKIELSFLLLFLQPNTTDILNKISYSDAFADEFSFIDTKKIIESAKTFSDALDKVYEVKTNKITESPKYDFTDPKILEKLRLDNPDFDKAYDIFKVDCRSVIEAGRK